MEGRGMGEEKLKKDQRVGTDEISELQHANLQSDRYAKTAYISRI